MEFLQKLFNALWQQDLPVLTDPSLVWVLYIVLFVIIFLESGFLPTSFLPGDSLLLLSGVLVATGMFELIITLPLLIAAAGLGSWFGYIQGHWLRRSVTIQRWLAHIPERYQQKTQELLERHGMAAMIFGRFLAFVRTLLPVMIGVSGSLTIRFQLINWLSAIIWVSVISGTGYLLSLTQTFQQYYDEILSILFIIPVFLLVSGLAGILFVFLHKKR